MTKQQTEFLHQEIDRAIDKATRRFRNATDDEICEWVYQVGLSAFSDQLKLARATKDLKPWTKLRIIYQRFRKLTRRGRARTPKKTLSQNQLKVSHPEIK